MRAFVNPEFKAIIRDIIQRRGESLNKLESGSSMVNVRHVGKELICIYICHTSETVTVRTVKEIFSHIFDNGKLHLAGPWTEMDVELRLSEIEITSV